MYNPNQSEYISIVADAFRAAGLPPELGCAIARQESFWDPNAKVIYGPDGERGGSYGLCQMSLQTARGLGFTGTPTELCDPKTNAELAAKLCVENHRKDETMADLIARYNSGKPMSRAPASTTQMYVPRVLGFMANYKSLV